MDPIIAKFAEKGYDAEGAFDMLDDNGDGVLTIQEIKDGMKMHKIELSDDQWDKFLSIIDANSDGVLDFDEWMAILTPRVAAAGDLYKLMGGVNISDPLVLEERILDLKYRNKHLESELKILRKQTGAVSKKDLQKMSKNILKAE